MLKARPLAVAVIAATALFGSIGVVAAPAQASPFTVYQDAAITNHSQYPLVLSKITDHWQGDAIVKGEWARGEGHGPEKGMVLEPGATTTLKFVDWLVTRESVTMTFETPHANRLITVKIGDQNYGNFSEVTAKRGLDIAVPGAQRNIVIVSPPITDGPPAYTTPGQVVDCLGLACQN